MTEYDIGRLTYLALLLAFASGFLWLSGRYRLGRHLRDAVAWVAIFGIFIILYAERDVLLAELSPPRTQVVGEGRIAIDRSLNGGYEAHVEVNGHPVRFLVDTGATDIVLSMEDAQRIGLNPETLIFDSSASTANGVVKIADVILAEITLGEVTERDVRASVNSGALHASLLGMSYLDRFARIEIERDQMLLIRR